jgi:hypothetical protein
MPLNPFLFQKELKDYFKEQNKIWEFYATNNFKVEEYEHFKTDILKTTRPISKEEQANYQTLIDEIQEKFKLNIPVFLYKDQNHSRKNSSVFYINSEAHILISERIFNKLSLEEIKVVLANKLGHVLLYTLDEGDFQTTERILNAISEDSRSPISYFETARIYYKYTDLFCDYVSYLVCNDRKLVNETLLKVHTELENVKQMNEFLCKEIDKNYHGPEPEIYFRLKLLELISSDFKNDMNVISPYIEGSNSISELPILEQKKWQEITYTWITFILSPPFMKSTLNLKHAKTFFPKFEANEAFIENSENLKLKIENGNLTQKEYLCYILLDFVLIDNEIFNYAFLWALQISETYKVNVEFEKIAKKELSLSELTFKDLVKNCWREYSILAQGQTQNLEHLSSVIYSSKK